MSDIDPIDALAVTGAALLALSAGLSFGLAAALAVVGSLALIYAILASRSPGGTP